MKHVSQLLYQPVRVLQSTQDFWFFLTCVWCFNFCYKLGFNQASKRTLHCCHAKALAHTASLSDTWPLGCQLASLHMWCTSFKSPLIWSSIIARSIIFPLNIYGFVFLLLLLLFCFLSHCIQVVHVPLWLAFGLLVFLLSSVWELTYFHGFDYAFNTADAQSLLTILPLHLTTSYLFLAICTLW